jgi:uncharacterized protein (TIGR02301 family)
MKVLFVAAALAATSPQTPRSPEQRQVLLDLAFVLGEAHALRAACRGDEDQTWRTRMSALIEVERAEEAFRRLLVDRFNAGFAGRRTATPTCAPDTPAEERAVAARGQALADRLAR